VPPPQAIPESPAITPQNPGNFIAIPFGGTPYDPLGKRRRPEINEAAIAPQNPQVPPAEAPAIAPAPQAPVAPDRPLEQYTNDEIAEEITTLAHTTLPTL
jgi:hypothetical protein